MLKTFKSLILFISRIKMGFEVVDMFAKDKAHCNISKQESHDLLFLRGQCMSHTCLKNLCKFQRYFKSFNLRHLEIFWCTFSFMEICNSPRRLNIFCLPFWRLHSKDGCGWWQKGDYKRRDLATYIFIILVAGVLSFHPLYLGFPHDYSRVKSGFCSSKMLRMMNRS